MRTFEPIVKAILFLLLVLALSAPKGVFALDVDGPTVSGDGTEKPLTLEEDSAVLPSSPDPETATMPQIAFSAINPGYNLPEGKNSGELIELINLSKEEIDLSDISIIYTSKPTTTSPTGKSTILYAFPDGATFIGDTILLRYASSPEAADNAQDAIYDATSMAMAGSLQLVKDEEILSSVCWLGGEDCLPVFSTSVKSRSYTTIVLDDETSSYIHVQEYTPSFDADNPGLYLPPEPDPDGTSQTNSPEILSATESVSHFCAGLEFSELLTYYENEPTEQFIELYNSSSTVISLEKCHLRYKNKTYQLSSTPSLLAPSSYYVYHSPVTLTKNPTTSNLYEIIDVNSDVVDSLSLPHGQKKSTSYALISKDSDESELWQVTFSPTPGAPNNYQEYRNCPAGKIINPETGNCVNDSDDDDELAPCQEGYERNPETGRCRKIKQNNGADYPLVPVTDKEDSTSFVALWALVGVLALGACYVLFQFRRDIYYTIRRLLNKIKKST